MSFLHKRTVINSVIMTSALVTAITTIMNVSITYLQYSKEEKPSVIVVGNNQYSSIDTVHESSNAKIDMLDAISIAQKTINGKALDAELTQYSGKLSYLVQVSSKGKDRSVVIDAENGKILKV